MVAAIRRIDRVAIPWRDVARWALVGTLLIVLWAFFDVQRSGGNPLSFIQPGEAGPSVAAFHQDFPETQLPDGIGLDGQQFYAIARNPFHLREVAPALDRPRYRLQRPLLPWLAWLLHPTGGGEGLVWALVTVEIAAILFGAVAAGALAVQLGGRPWFAALFSFSLGAWFCVRTTGADVLALGLAFGAIALAHHGRLALAIACGVAAVLAKEVIAIVLIGWLLWRRSREALLVVAVAFGAGAVWWLALHGLVSSEPEKIGEFVAPLSGWRESWTNRWSDGHELVGMASAFGSVTVAVAALVRHRLRHPMSWAIVLSLGMAAVGNGDVIGNNYGSTRTLMPLLMVSLLALCSSGHPVLDETSPSHSSTGIDGPGAGSGAVSNR